MIPQVKSGDCGVNPAQLPLEALQQQLIDNRKILK
jgi:hypothetical protein